MVTLLQVYTNKSYFFTLRFAVFPHYLFYLTSFTAMAAKFAKSIRAKKLILTHFSQRYKANNESLKPGEESVMKLLHEAKNEFENVVMAYDMLAVNVPRTSFK